MAIPLSQVGLTKKTTTTGKWTTKEPLKTTEKTTTKAPSTTMVKTSPDNELRANNEPSTTMTTTTTVITTSKICSCYFNT